MANNGFINGRQFPHALAPRGLGYESALQSRAQSIVTTLQAILASNYQATIPSTEYALHLRTMAIELSKLTLFLEDQITDLDFEDLRGEYLQQLLGYFVFLNGRLPELNFTDESYRSFLLAVIQIFFKGSTPVAIQEGIELALSLPFELRENFIDARSPGSPYDISDQFGFTILLEGSATLPQDYFQQQGVLRLLLDLIRPAHTLYRFSLLFRDGNTPGDKVIQPKGSFSGDMRWGLYEDVRRYCQGIAPAQYSTGQITSLGTFTDASAPLQEVATLTYLTILEGPNTGTYLVLENEGGTLHTHPRFKALESAVRYRIEFDRKGRNSEVSVQGEIPYIYTP